MLCFCWIYAHKTGLDTINGSTVRAGDVARELGSSADWSKLALELGLPDDDARQIGAEYQSEPNDQKSLVVLRVWLERLGPRATAQLLDKALKRLKYMKYIEICVCFKDMIKYHSIRRGDVAKKLFPHLQHEPQTATPTPTGGEAKMVAEHKVTTTTTLGSAAPPQPPPKPVPTKQQQRPEETPPAPPKPAARVAEKFSPGILPKGLLINHASKNGCKPFLVPDKTGLDEKADLHYPDEVDFSVVVPPAPHSQTSSKVVTQEVISKKRPEIIEPPHVPQVRFHAKILKTFIGKSVFIGSRTGRLQRIG